jgi:hypothetical protein
MRFAEIMPLQRMTTVLSVDSRWLMARNAILHRPGFGTDQQMNDGRIGAVSGSAQGELLLKVMRCV